LNSLHESPDFLKTTLFDVKRSTGMITQRIDKIALDIEQGIDTTRSEAKEEAKSDSETVGQDKPVLEAVAAKAMPKEELEPTTEEEHYYHRGR
jgi:uncharacterized protein involved in exopolysaccharide biosynthesis